MEIDCVKTISNKKISADAAVSMIKVGKNMFKVNSIFDESISLQDLLFNLAEPELTANKDIFMKVNDENGHFKYNYSGS